MHGLDETRPIDAVTKRPPQTSHADLHDTWRHCNVWPQRRQQVITFNEPSGSRYKVDEDRAVSRAERYALGALPEAALLSIEPVGSEHGPAGRATFWLRHGFHHNFTDDSRLSRVSLVQEG